MDQGYCHSGVNDTTRNPRVTKNLESFSLIQTKSTGTVAMGSSQNVVSLSSLPTPSSFAS